MRNEELKTAIISGGLGLLGKEFAKALSQHYNVVCLDLEEKVDAFYKGVEDYYFYSFGCDITDEKNVAKVISFVYDEWKHIDILINCAAINPTPRINEFNTFEKYSLDAWGKTLDTNLTGTFLMSRECIKYMLKNKVVKEKFNGTIVNIASDLGINAPDQDIYENDYNKPSDYGVSKAGIINLTKYIASYYGNIIKSICLAPGGVYNGQSEQFVKNLTSRIPIGRMARKEEYNGIIKFMCSEDSDYMQGQTIIADGGRSII